MQWIVGLNALRLFAIILIVVYHFFAHFLPGGFIAVEIFFAISGFLIVGNIAKNYQKTSRFLYRDFIRGRFARLFPPLLLMVLTVLTLALLAHPDILAGIGPRSLSALTFSTNIFELATGGGYENFISPNLFRHTWFLALEMQLYLLVPLVFLLAVKQSRNKQKGLIIAATTFGVLGLISAILMILYGGVFGLTDRAYFAPDSHMFSFCFGAALGIAMQLYKPQKATKTTPPALAIATILATIVIFAKGISYSKPISFFLVLPLVGLLSVIMIYYVLKLQRHKRHGRIMCALEYLGGMSYGIYLFHYPFYLLFGYILPAETPAWIYSSVALVCSILLTILCDHLIKNVKKLLILYKKHSLSIRHRVATVAYVVTFMALIAGSIARVATISANSNISAELAAQNKQNNSTELNVPDSATIIGDAVTLVGAGLSAVETAAPVYTPQVVLPQNKTITAGTKVLLIGDSVMLGAKNNLEAKIPNSFVDAKESRGIEKATEIINSVRAQGMLPEIIVIGLVTNQRYISAATYDAILNAAGPNHKFILVTGYCGPTQSRDSQNAVTRDYANTHDNVWLADWYALAINDWSLMYSDHTHLDFSGRETYTNLIANIIKEIQ